MWHLPPGRREHAMTNALLLSATASAQQQARSCSRMHWPAIQLQCPALGNGAVLCQSHAVVLQVVLVKHQCGLTLCARTSRGMTAWHLQDVQMALTPMYMLNNHSDLRLRCCGLMQCESIGMLIQHEGQACPLS